MPKIACIDRSLGEAYESKVKKILIVCGYILLFFAALYALFYLYYFYGLLYNVIYNFVLAKTASVILVFIAAEVVTPLIVIITSLLIIGIHLICSYFAAKISCNYQSFKSESNDFNFSEVYKDPTIGLKDKILFFLIHSIYCIQFPFLYLASQVSNSMTSEYAQDGRIIISLMVVHSILIIPVAILELIKYPLIKLFSPLGLNVKQLSFLFNVSDVGTGGQSVHTSSFEHSIVQCAQDLKQKFGAQPNVLNKEFENHINDSSELTAAQKELLNFILTLTALIKQLIVNQKLN
ncbi:hypothetical protein [Wolbachia endosymbiont (group E) of Neria commutata]|uniref:hypothetical protein n=1 Tax=Wolbachia endosymbiont (group E) of Neria commutata TaxID=3066149 RepID=UPI003132BD7C